MNMIADILMIAGTFGVGFYCYVLAARLKKFSTLESGMGTAIAVLSSQVDEMTRALDAARSTAAGSATRLESLTARAEATAARLEVMLASMHDLPDPPAEPEADSIERRVRFVRRRPAREGLEAAE